VLAAETPGGDELLAMNSSTSQPRVAGSRSTEALNTNQPPGANGNAVRDRVGSALDTAFSGMAARWGRRSLRTSATLLRRWFAYCESRGWVRGRLAAAVLLPRLYREEGLPLGPSWNEVGRMLAAAAGDEPKDVRDQAILRLLSVYGLRSGEVRRLTLDDFDWQNDRIRVIRSKSLREQTLPLEPSSVASAARVALARGARAAVQGETICRHD
jgi:integrase